VADTTINFPATGGLTAGSATEVNFPPVVGVVRAAGGATITPFVYVVDSGNNRIQVFSYDLVFLFSFGEYGTGASS